MSAVSFTVQGTPAPKGSFRISGGRGRTRSGKQRMVVRSDSPRTDAWESAVAWFARNAMRGRPPIDGAVHVVLQFWMPRPKRPRSSVPDVKPDIDKLTRSTLDAMNGIAYRDDAAVCALTATKNYAPVAHMVGATVTVSPLVSQERAAGEPGARIEAEDIEP